MPFGDGYYTLDKLKNKQHVKGWIDDFKRLADEPTKRIKAICLILLDKGHIFTPKEQECIGGHLAQLVLSQWENPLVCRKMLNKIANVIIEKQYESFKITQAIVNKVHQSAISEMLEGAKLQRIITEHEVNFQPEPMRIITCHKEDLKNPEVFEAVKIAYKKHGGEENCVISCSEHEIRSFGNAPSKEERPRTLVFLGHGNIYIKGAPDPRDPTVKLTEEAAGKERQTAMVTIGPFKDVYPKVAKKIGDLLIASNIQHCRLSMCLSGLPADEFSEMDTVYYKQYNKRPVSPATGRASATVIWSAETPETMIFHKHSIAGMVWDYLAQHGFLNDEKDFALTASPYIINPITSTPADETGHFEGSYNNDRWTKGIYKPGLSFWEDSLKPIEKTKSITQATKASSKLNRQINGEMGADTVFKGPTYSKGPYSKGK